MHLLNNSCFRRTDETKNLPKNTTELPYNYNFKFLLVVVKFMTNETKPISIDLAGFYCHHKIITFRSLCFSKDVDKCNSKWVVSYKKFIARNKDKVLSAKNWQIFSKYQSSFLLSNTLNHVIRYMYICCFKPCNIYCLLLSNK